MVFKVFIAIYLAYDSALIILFLAIWALLACSYKTAAASLANFSSSAASLAYLLAWSNNFFSSSDYSANSFWVTASASAFLEARSCICFMDLAKIQGGH